MEDVIRYLGERDIPFHIEDNLMRRRGKTSRSVMRALAAASNGNKVLYMSTNHTTSEYARTMAVMLCSTLRWNVLDEKRKRRIVIQDERGREIGQVDFYDLDNGISGLNFTMGVIDQDH